jgi:hypothetical protein
MIIPINNSKHINRTFFLIIDNNYSVKQFLEATKVAENSYAWKLMKRIYECLRTGNVNIIIEYNKYYKQEYSTMRDYLYRKYNCDDSMINTIIENINQNKVLEFGDVDSGGDYNLGHLIMTEEIMNTLNEIIE